VPSHFYKLGIRAALQRFKSDDEDRYGAPFPEKSPTINAEAFAKRLHEDDDSAGFVSPENAHHRELGRPVTWDHAAHIDENQPSAGMMLPSNPRG